MMVQLKLSKVNYAAPVYFIDMIYQLRCIQAYTMRHLIKINCFRVQSNLYDWLCCNLEIKFLFIEFFLYKSPRLTSHFRGISWNTR